VKLTRSEAAKLRYATARVEGWLLAADVDDLALGLRWYDNAYAIAEELARESDLMKSGDMLRPIRGWSLTVRQCAGIIAALSPRCQWASNVAGARAMVRAAMMGEPEPVVAGTRGNRRKAWRIANGADPDAVLSGPKVRAFWANICGDVEAVTVDVWAARAAEGHANDQAPVRRRYELVSEAYRRAARRFGLTPRDAQAAVWTIYRRTYGHPYDPSEATT
jgi:hypothetical protein